MTTTVRYATREIRDAVLRTPMKDGLAVSYETLAEILASAEIGRAHV